MYSITASLQSQNKLQSITRITNLETNTSNRIGNRTHIFKICPIRIPRFAINNVFIRLLCLLCCLTVFVIFIGEKLKNIPKFILLSTIYRLTTDAYYVYYCLAMDVIFCDVTTFIQSLLRPM